MSASTILSLSRNMIFVQVRIWCLTCSSPTIFSNCLLKFSKKYFLSRKIKNVSLLIQFSRLLTNSKVVILNEMSNVISYLWVGLFLCSIPLQKRNRKCFSSFCYSEGKDSGGIESIHQNYFYENIHHEFQIIRVTIASLFSLTMVEICSSTPLLYP